jgi:hypothetical protein
MLAWLQSGSVGSPASALKGSPWRLATFRCVNRKADEGGIPGRISTEENAARCVPGRREAPTDFPSRALGLVCGLSGFEDFDEAPHCYQCIPQFVDTDFSSDPVAPGVRNEGDSANGPIARLGTRKQLGAPMIRIGAVLSEITFDQQISDALHTLPRHAHAPADGCDAAWLVQDAAKDLPPGCCQVPICCELLSGFEETRVEAEGRKDDIGECGAGFRARNGLRPDVARRNGPVAHALTGAHAAFCDCISTGKAS